MRRYSLVLALVSCLGLSNMSDAQQSFRNKVGNWEIGLNARGPTPYCYASLDFAPGRKLIFNVMRTPGLVLTLWDQRWSLPQGAAISVEAAFDAEPPRSLPAQIFTPQLVIIPILDWRPFVDRLAMARRVVMTVERQRLAIDLSDAASAYAEARKCIDGSAATPRSQGSAEPERVAGWILTADRSGDEFKGCTAVPDRREQPIAFKVSRRFQYFVSVINPRWQLPVDKLIEATVRIDGVSFANLADVPAPTVALIPIEDQRAFLDRLRSGRSMTVQIGGTGVTTDIAGAATAVAALEQCARREVAGDGPRISSGGYTLQQVQAFAIALLRDAGIDGFDMRPDEESFRQAQNIGWLYTDDRGAGTLQLLRNAPPDYLETRAKRLLSLFRPGCTGLYDARVLDSTEGPGWQARRLFTFCSEHETPGQAGVTRWIVLRLDNGIGLTFGSMRAADDDNPGEAFSKGGEIDEAVWRSKLLQQPPTE